jgi:hypothetical protein
VPLLVASIGVLGTLAGGLGGVLITQRRADEREGKAWAREREREREQWYREDLARTFEHRREACVEFYRSLCAARDEIRGNGRRLPADEERVDELGEVLFEQFSTLNLYASPELTDGASKTIEAIRRLGWSLNEDTSQPEDPGLREKYFAAEDDLVQLIRRELSVSFDSAGSVRGG